MRKPKTRSHEFELIVTLVALLLMVIGTYISLKIT